MNTKSKIAIVITSLLIAFAFGRYTVPTSVKTETDVTHNDKKSEEDKMNKHTKTVTVTAPDGTKTTTRETDISKDNKSTNVSAEIKVDKSEVTRSGSRLTISALGGTKVQFSALPTMFYGGIIQHDLIGPINMGVFGLSNGEAGIALGLSF